MELILQVNKEYVRSEYVVLDSEMVIICKKTPTSAQQQLFSDDNKLPSGEFGVTD